MNGRMRFVATGRQQDKTVKIELSADVAQAPAANADTSQDSGADPLGLAFDRLQRSAGVLRIRSDEHTYELQSLMHISYAVFCLKKKTTQSSSATLTSHTADTQ